MTQKERPHRHHSLWSKIRSVFLWAVCGSVMVMMTLGVLILGLFLKPLQLDPFLHFMIRIFVFCTGVKVSVEGLEKLDPEKPYLIVFNHINMLDHFFMYYALKRKVRGVEREDHFNWPVYGLMARKVGLVPIAPRGNTASAIRSLARLKEYFEQGVSVVVVPEGTRSYDGKLQPFKKGAFHLAVQTEATIVPMVFVGAYEIMRKHDWVMYPGPLKIYLEDPIPVSSDMNVTELSKKVRSVIEKRLT